VTFPDAITTHHNEVHFVAELDAFDVWETCDRLLFQTQVRILLVAQVTDRSGKVKISIDSSFGIYV